MLTDLTLFALPIWIQEEYSYITRYSRFDWH